MSPQPSVPQPPVPHQPSGLRKAAILLMGIGEPGSSHLIRQLDHHEIRLISAEIASLRAIAPEQVIGVFREFETLSSSSRFFARGGPERARRLLEEAVGPVEAVKFLDPEPPAVERPRAPDGGGPFSGIEPSELAAALRDENPQTLALILSNLPPEQAGPLMATLPAETQPQAALRIALMDRIAPEVFNQIAEAVRGKLKATRQLQRANGTRALASILTCMDGEKAESVLTAMEVDNQPTAASVRVLMFLFDDIIRIDKESIRALIGRLDRKVLTLALKGTTEQMKTHFTQCMSQRSAEMLTEDMEALGPVRIRDVSAAQQQIITTIRQLEKEGVITIRGGSGAGDEYVV
ncbi:MAG TPA: flagellar motor switch protein FliG [Bryobacteraceae bacterium]|nr:flagellar motor switch protein FliG [Bryobacteraceae bacterium]